MLSTFFFMNKNYANSIDWYLHGYLPPPKQGHQQDSHCVCQSSGICGYPRVALTDVTRSLLLSATIFNSTGYNINTDFPPSSAAPLSHYCLHTILSASLRATGSPVAASILISSHRPIVKTPTFCISDWFAPHL